MRKEETNLLNLLDELNIEFITDEIDDTLFTEILFNEFEDMLYIEYNPKSKKYIMTFHLSIDSELNESDWDIISDSFNNSRYFLKEILEDESGDIYMREEIPFKDIPKYLKVSDDLINKKLDPEFNKILSYYKK